jgi:hypothetical protein
MTWWKTTKNITPSTVAVSGVEVRTPIVVTPDSTLEFLLLPPSENERPRVALLLQHTDPTGNPIAFKVKGFES